MWQWWWVPSYIPFFNVTSTILPLRGAGLALSSRVDGPSWLHSRTPGSRGDAMWLLELGHQRVQLPNARWDTHPWSHQPPYKEFTDRSTRATVTILFFCLKLFVIIGLKHRCLSANVLYDFTLVYFLLHHFCLTHTELFSFPPTPHDISHLISAFITVLQASLHCYFHSSFKAQFKCYLLLF